MSALWLHMIGVLTVFLMLMFVGIWVWAWNSRHAGTFAHLARLPLTAEQIDTHQGEEGQP
jgi:cytochrome c oxidase cbb3-type subunit 4